MRKLVPMPLILLSFIGISCGKEKGVISQQQMNANETINFTAADADEAYKAFNTYFYDPTAKLYYSTTKQDGPGAIWTQAIYWDMAMDVYEGTKNASQLTMINDIYTGGFNQYDGYNWDNSTKWFIYDDMMWWVAALARANQLTGNAIYLQKSIEGFNHVWAGSYDPDKGGMFWDFSHRR